MKANLLFFLLVMPIPTLCFFQEANYHPCKTKECATKMSEIWYGSSKAKAVAVNHILPQKDIIGWKYTEEFHQSVGKGEKIELS